MRNSEVASICAELERLRRLQNQVVDLTEERDDLIYQLERSMEQLADLEAVNQREAHAVAESQALASENEELQRQLRAQKTHAQQRETELLAKIVALERTRPLGQDDDQTLIGGRNEIAKLTAALEVQTALLNSTEAAIIAVGEDHCITEWNRAAEKISKLKKEQVIGQHKLFSFCISFSGCLYQ